MRNRAGPVGVYIRGAPGGAKTKSMSTTGDSVKGGISTCFLTTRLPLWAGVRQNVVGSNITGTAVKSDVYTSPAELATNYAAQGLTDAAVAMAVDGAATATAVSGAALLEEVRRLTESVTNMETNMATLQASMTALETTLDAIKSGAATS